MLCRRFRPARCVFLSGRMGSGMILKTFRTLQAFYVYGEGQG